jgi:osmotically-inducible protein OsmY
MAVQRTDRLVRRTLGGLGKAGRKMGSNISGKRQALMHARDAHEPLDDATLAHKVESVLFRDPHVPKGRININAEHGVVVLRGEVEEPSDLRDIERSVKDIAGVHEVRSLLHLANSDR